MKQFLMVTFFTCLWTMAGLANAQGSGFGFSRSGESIVVDTGADLVFSINTRNGDLTAIRYHGDELQTSERKYSQIASGLGAAQVDVKNVGDVIVVSAQAGDLTQYYMAHKGRNAIYMATYAPTLLPVGELRFVLRLNVNKFPKAARGNDSNVGQAIEGKDVFLLPDGRTSSKFYSAAPMMDDPLHGVSGPGVAAYMLMGNREHSSGGPFFKDIATQKTAVTHEMYNYMFSNHTQTEAYRGGLYGVYGLLFTNGEAPSGLLTNLGFVNQSLGLKGFLDSAGRGAVRGHIAGVPVSLPALIGLSNAQAEYWVRPGANGDFALTGVRPGQYRATLYQNQLEVGQSTVEIKAAETARVALQAKTPAGQIKWQIGLLDGTPTGFRNASLLPFAHPSDSKMAPWMPTLYTVGASALSDFPAVQWRGVNSPTRIKFELAHNEVRDYHLRLYISLAQFGGRPQVTVNQSWHAEVPPPSQQPDSRGITRGTFRGNNTLFEVSVPGTALHAGTNSLEIGVASGKAGDGFLSPGFVFDSVQWVEE